MENEIWKDIAGYEGLYQVSNMGGIRSCDRVITDSRGAKRFIKGRMIRPSLNNHGYYITHLCKDGKYRSTCVHRFVAIAFIGPVPDGMEVDHINEDKKDNRASNLRYISRFENASRSTKGVFRKESNAMEHNPRAKKVVGYNSGVIVETFPCAKYLSRVYRINYSTLRERLRNGGIEIGETIYKYEDKS